MNTSQKHCRLHDERRQTMHFAKCIKGLGVRPGNRWAELFASRGCGFQRTIVAGKAVAGLSGAATRVALPAAASPKGSWHTTR